MSLPRPRHDDNSPTGSHKRRSTSSADLDAPTFVPAASPSSATPATHFSAAMARAEKPKRWMKTYRTEIAASTSSVMSTFFAVSLEHVPGIPQA